MRGRRGLFAAGLLSALLLLGGCATYSQQFDAVEAQLAAGDVPAALKALDEQHGKGGRGDRVLYLLNRALLLRMQGEYAQSNEMLEQAKRLIDELDAVSVSEQAGSLTVNDTLKSFIGSDFERALIHLYAALNYLQLGKEDEARVEALQLDVLLNLQADRHGDGYVEDAYVRYLSGLVFEELGEWSDAMIAYRKAYEDYRRYQQAFGVRPPRSLGFALLRLAEHLGLKDEVREYRAAFGIEQWPPLQALKSKGEVVIIVSTGLAPSKRQEVATVFAPEAGVMVRIALPRYEPHIQPVGEVRVRVDDEAQDAELVEDIDALAIRTLEEQMPMITARAIARAVVKYQAAREASKHNEGLGLLVNIAGMISEQADTRSWSTLPQRVYLARRLLPPGRHDVVVQLFGHDGHVLAQKRFPGVTVEAGRKAYLTWRWIPPFRVHGEKRS